MGRPKAMFAAWRIIGGIAIGMASNLSPMYIAEVSPAGAGMQEILNSWNGQTGWRCMFAATAVPSLIFFLLMFAVPERPRWLVKNGKGDKARKVLVRIGGDAYADQAFAQIIGTLIDEVGKVHFRDLLESKMTKILLIGLILAVFQQWCGINLIFNYAEEVFSAAGYDVSPDSVQHCDHRHGEVFFTRARLPETKGKTLEEIERELVD